MLSIIESLRISRGDASSWGSLHRVLSIGVRRD